jgi:hypothetical protein
VEWFNSKWPVTVTLFWCVHPGVPVASIPLSSGPYYIGRAGQAKAAVFVFLAVVVFVGSGVPK